jgi:regulatory protein
MAFGRKPGKRKPLAPAALYEYALAALGRRMMTVAQMKKQLQTRAEEGEAGEAAVEAVLIKLKEHGYLNDVEYAASYTRLRMENEKFGQRRVRQDLMQKGIHGETIAKTLEAGYEEVDEEQLARKFLARKRVKQPEGPDAQKQIARILRLMIRGGFSTTVIFKILRNWNIPEEDMASIESIEEEVSGHPEESEGE